MASVAVVGLGKIGTAVVHAAVSADHRVIIWNRSARQLPLFSDREVAIAATLAAAVEAAEIVVLCVTSYDAARSLVSDIMHLDGRCVVQLATGTPQEAGEMAQFIASKGAQYLDGKVLGGPEAIRTHSGQVFLAGPFDVFESHRRALNFLGGDVRHAGEEFGAASALDLSWLCQRFGLFLGLRQGVHLCQAYGVDPRQLAGLFPEGDRSRLFLDTLTGDASADPHASLSTWNEALNRGIAAARLAGLEPALLEMASRVFGDAIRSGRGEDDVSAIASVADAT